MFLIIFVRLFGPFCPFNSAYEFSQERYQQCWQLAWVPVLEQMGGSCPAPSVHALDPAKDDGWTFKACQLLQFWDRSP